MKTTMQNALARKKATTRQRDNNGTILSSTVAKNLAAASRLLVALPLFGIYMCGKGDSLQQLYNYRIFNANPQLLKLHWWNPAGPRGIIEFP